MGRKQARRKTRDRRRDAPSTKPPGRQRFAVAMFAVFVVALSARATFWADQRSENPFFFAPALDERVHHEWAQQLAAGTGLGDQPYFRAPLYYHVLGALYATIGPDLAAARFVGCVAGSINCVLIACLGAALVNRRAGIVAGLLAALYWPLIYFDLQLLSVSLEILFNLLTLYLLLRAAQESSLALYAAGGLAWGLAALTRPNILILAPLLIAWPWLSRPLGKRTARPRPALGLLLTGAALVILPVTLRNRIVGGEWVLIAANAGVNFHIGNNPAATGTSASAPELPPHWQGGFEGTQDLPQRTLGRELSRSEVSAWWFDRALTWIRENPGAWLALTFEKFRLFWSPIEIPNNQAIQYFVERSPLAYLMWLGFPLITVLAVAALPLLRNGRAWLLPIAAGALYMASVILFFCPARYRLPVTPVLILLAAAGLVRLAEHARAKSRKRLAVAGVAGLAAIAFLWTNPPAREPFQRKTEAMAHNNLGQHYRRLAESRGDRTLLEQARLHLETATELHPDNPATFVALGECLRDLGNADGAAAAFRGALSIRSDLPSAHHELGLLLARQQRFDEALRHFQFVVRERPDDPAARLNLANTLGALNRHSDAIPRYEQVLANEPGSVGALRGLAFAQRRAGRHAAAAETLRAALTHHPDDAYFLQRRAWLLATSARQEVRNGPEAVRLAERALDRADRPTVALLETLAAAYAATDRFAEAARLLQQAAGAAQSGGDTAVAARLLQRARLYQARQPYYEYE